MMVRRARGSSRIRHPINTAEYDATTRCSSIYTRINQMLEMYDEVIDGSNDYL
jgi:hypothetical protein